MSREAGRPHVTMRIRPSDLCRTPPAGAAEDRFIAQLGSVGLGSSSYVVAPREAQTPEWIVLGYATGEHERVWRRSRKHTDGVLAYRLVEDDSSSGYVSVA